MHYDSFASWAIAQHQNTNHMYDGKLGDPTALPYSYHLKLVSDVIKKFKWLVDSLHAKELCPNYDVIFAAAWGHDLIEDARATYNDVVTMASNFFSKGEAVEIAEIIRAVTNYGRGRNRKERMPFEIYEDIFKTPGAIIVKCADRAGNLKHGLLAGSSQKAMYKKENPHFEKMLFRPDLKPMFDYIQKLIDTEI